MDELAEVSMDKIWGIGKRLNYKDISEKDKWTGQNYLGQILASVRETQVLFSVSFLQCMSYNYIVKC